MSVYYECEMCGEKNLKTSEVREVIIRGRESVDYEDRPWCVFEGDICPNCEEKIRKPFRERARKWHEEYESKEKAKQIAKEVIREIEKSFF